MYRRTRLCYTREKKNPALRRKKKVKGEEVN